MSSLPLFIIYGSATGNSESIAKDLAAKYQDALPKPFTEIVCCEGNQFKKKCLPTLEKQPDEDDESLKYGVIVVISTTGNGDSPENGSRFVRYIKRNTTIDSMPMRHAAFAVLGLGTKSSFLFE